MDMVPAVLRELLEYLEASGQDLASLRMLNCGADLGPRRSISAPGGSRKSHVCSAAMA